MTFAPTPAASSVAMAASALPPPDEAVALPTDELGLRMLARLCDDLTRQRHKPISHVGFTSDLLLDAPKPAALQEYATVDSRQLRRHYPDYARALDEGWAWLVRQGLIAEDSNRRGGQKDLIYFFVTRLGWQVNKREDARQQLKATARLDMDLHPRIADRVRTQFLLGEHDGAVLVAMREVEVRVRELVGGSDSDLGTVLMKEAFKRGGPLHDSEMDKGEADATMALFWGALGVFKNPVSHRNVQYDDPTMASEVILLADLLLRILDRTESRLDN